MTAKRAASRLTRWPSAVLAEFVQLAVIRHPISLLVMLTVALGVFRIPHLLLDLMGAGANGPPLLEAYPLVLCASAGWASVVWSELRPAQRWYVYALPVRHTTFLLARATAGALWLVLLLGMALGVCVAAGDGAAFVSVRGLLVMYAAGAAIVFGLVSALAILVRVPLYVAFAALAIPLAAGRVLRLNNLANFADYADRFILGPYGLFGALVNVSVRRVNAQFDFTPADTWSVAVAIWMAIALLGMVGAARFMSRR